MSTVTPGSTALVLSRTATSMRPVDTCAIDGVAAASQTAAHNAINLAIRKLIIHPPRQKTRANTQIDGDRKTNEPLWGARPGKARSNAEGLAGEAVEDVHEFRKSLCTVWIPFVDPFRHALLDVEAEHSQADSIEGRFGGGELLENLDAEAGLLDHPAYATHLPLDAVQSRDDCLLLGLVQHGLTLT